MHVDQNHAETGMIYKADRDRDLSAETSSFHHHHHHRCRYHTINTCESTALCFTADSNKLLRAAATICHRPGLQVVTRYTSCTQLCVWKGHHYCMSMLACQYNRPKRPGDLELWHFDLESVVRDSESRVTWAISVPILVLLGLSVLDLGPIYAPDRQSDVRQHHRLMPRGRGIKT